MIGLKIFYEINIIFTKKMQILLLTLLLLFIVKIIQLEYKSVTDLLEKQCVTPNSSNSLDTNFNLTAAWKVKKKKLREKSGNLSTRPSFHVKCDIFCGSTSLLEFVRYGCAFIADEYVRTTHLEWSLILWKDFSVAETKV